MKYILLISGLCLSACAPYVNAGNKTGVTIAVPAFSSYYEGAALAMADEHCGKYGLTARLRKPRSGDWGDMYDYYCVK